jgi:hypothetical protein
MKRVSAQKQARPNRPTASPHTMRPSLSEIRAIFGTAFQIVYSNYGRPGFGILWPAAWLAWTPAGLNLRPGFLQTMRGTREIKSADGQVRLGSAVLE